MCLKMLDYLQDVRDARCEVELVPELGEGHSTTLTMTWKPAIT